MERIFHFLRKVFCVWNAAEARSVIDEVGHVSRGHLKFLSLENLSISNINETIYNIAKQKTRKFESDFL